MKKNLHKKLFFFQEQKTSFEKKNSFFSRIKNIVWKKNSFFFKNKKHRLKKKTVFFETLPVIQEDENDMPAYFKFLTVMALKVFIEQGVDVAILEVGIGGEYDCTNVVRWAF